MANDFSIKLTPSEQSLLDQLKFDVSSLRSDHAQSNGDLACRLMKSLIARKAIPDLRMKYFCNPSYNIGGRGRSREQVFIKNCTCGDEIFKHSNFLQHLYYFLFGANLPSTVRTIFADKIAACGHVTSSDVIPLGAFARQQTRAYNLNPSEAADEFYKLALDLNLAPSYAAIVRKAVKQAR